MGLTCLTCGTHFCPKAFKAQVAMGVWVILEVARNFPTPVCRPGFLMWNSHLNLFRHILDRCQTATKKNNKKKNNMLCTQVCDSLRHVSSYLSLSWLLSHVKPSYYNGHNSHVHKLSDSHHPEMSKLDLSCVSFWGGSVAFVLGGWAGNDCLAGSACYHRGVLFL